MQTLDYPEKMTQAWTLNIYFGVFLSQKPPVTEIVAILALAPWAAYQHIVSIAMPQGAKVSTITFVNANIFPNGN